MIRFFLAALFVAVIVHVASMQAVPRLVMQFIVQHAEAASGSNVPVHRSLADAAARSIKLPSPDVFYSTCALDVSFGPVLVSVTPGAAYLSLAVFDMKTDNIFVANDASTPGRPIRVLVEGPGQSQTPPDGARIARIETSRGLVLLRALAATPELARISNAARQTFTCRVL